MNITPIETRIDSLAKAEIKAEKANRLLSELCALREKILTEFPINTFGLTKSEMKKSKEIPALIENLRIISNHPQRLKDHFANEDQQVLNQQKKLEEKVRQEQKELEESQVISDAILYLLEKRPDLKIGKDYTIFNATDLADQLAFQIAVNTQIEEIGDHFIEFIGDSNCEDCRGWDGFDRRCDCGNRRVNWEKDWDFSFKNPEIHAEAN